MKRRGIERDEAVERQIRSSGLWTLCICTMMAMANKPIVPRFLSEIRALFLVACLACLVAGCEDVASTSPFVGEGQAIVDERLLGTWVDPDDPDDPNEDELTVELERNNQYRFWSLEDGEIKEYSVQLTQIGSHHFLQIAHDCSSMHFFFKPDSGEPCYLPMKVEIEDNSFSLTTLDHKRLFRDSLAKKLSVEHEIRREVSKKGLVLTCIILTAPTKVLRSFLEACTADDSVFREESATYVRKRAG